MKGQVVFRRSFFVRSFQIGHNAGKEKRDTSFFVTARRDRRREYATPPWSGPSPGRRRLEREGDRSFFLRSFLLPACISFHRRRGREDRSARWEIQWWEPPALAILQAVTSTSQVWLSRSGLGRKRDRSFSSPPARPPPTWSGPRSAGGREKGTGRFFVFSWNEKGTGHFFFGHFCATPPWSGPSPGRRRLEREGDRSFFLRSFLLPACTSFHRRRGREDRSAMGNPMVGATCPSLA